MARPSRRNGTHNIQYTRRIPADIIKLLSNLPANYRPKGWGKQLITISTGTADKRRAAVEHARIAAEVEDRFAKLRAGERTLSHKQCVALAGEVYRAFAQAEDDPISADIWRHALAMNEAARSGRFGNANLVIGEDACRRASMEERFGEMADAALAHRGLTVDAQSRWRFIDALAGALDDAARKLARNAEGDYRPDPAADRFPKWDDYRTAANAGRGKAMSLSGLFKEWTEHPEQAEQAPSTILRYRGVIDAVSRFLGDPDIYSITGEQMKRYAEARMADPVRPIQPRVMRSVHKAALASVFGWAVRKGVLTFDPTSAIQIKVPKRKKLLRPKEASDDEARAIVTASLSIAAGVKAGTFEAAARWCPLLCLYTGSRIGEVTQLRKEDVLERDGCLALRLTPEAGAIKDAEVRFVPVHPRLVELGFIEFVKQARVGPLFFTLKSRRKPDAQSSQSSIVSKALARWARTNGLGDPLLMRPLHSFRHRFMTLARRAEVAEQYVEEIAGHSPGRQNRHYGQYPLDVLLREVRKLRSEAVEGQPK